MHRVLVLGLALLGLAWASAPAQAQPPARPPRVALGVMVEPTRDADRAGLVVRQVEPDSPAAKAGLRAGDTITKVEDKEVKDFEGLVNTLARHKPGDSLTFQVLRDGKEQDLKVTLGERPALLPGPRSEPAERRAAFLGVQTQRLTPELRDRLGLGADAGVIVTDVVANTPAAKAGLKPDDVITAVDGKNITDPAQLREAIQRAGAGKQVTLSLVRGKEKQEVKAELQEAPSDVGLGPRPMPLPGFPPGEFPGPAFDGQRHVQRLERRIEELEKRVRELEQKLGQKKSE
jgi:S1-C subfamily serine protease